MPPTQIYLLYVGNKLNTLGFTPTGIDTLGKQLEKAGYGLFYAGSSRNQLVRLLEMAVKFFQYRKQVHYILIDTYSTRSFWYAFFIGLLSYLFSKKYIPILRGGDMPSRLKRSKRVCDFLFSNSFQNVTVSGYLQSRLQEAGYGTMLIPNNIKLNNYPFTLRTISRPKMLWVRSFHQTYNPNMALDVLRELLLTYDDAYLCMVGPDKDGSLNKFINYACELGVENHIDIAGYLSKEEWTALARKYDFFINTTNFDNTPVSVIEAMALGLCIVTTNPGGIPYMLTHQKNAFLVAPGDHKGMADIISTLINHYNQYKTVVLNARNDVVAYDWSRIENKWKDLLK